MATHVRAVVYADRAKSGEASAGTCGDEDFFNWISCRNPNVGYSLYVSLINSSLMQCRVVVEISGSSSSTKNIQREVIVV
mmetsp:Transcript_14145/g.23655  ORF Transcript_14145/g.23655 Transcript_14145/m.23655 type:complete len:80 (-) Transcript_14145:57-296(-)